MIVSHKHKYIFMHGQKTAGSSITVALNASLGHDDIQLGIWGDTMKAGGRVNRKAAWIIACSLPRLLASSIKQTIIQHKLVSRMTWFHMNNAIIRYYRRRIGYLGPAAHPTAQEAKDYLGDMWSEYYKFTVVRNPWEQAVSLYHWQLADNGISLQDVSFNEFLRRFKDASRPDPEGVRPRLNTNWPIYTIDGVVVVDDIARFENLDNDLKKISSKIGVPIEMKVKAKSNIRSKNKPIKEYYDDECMTLVSEIYESEIKYFGYAPAWL